MKRMVIFTVAALIVSLTGVNGTSDAATAPGYCSTGFQTQTFPSNGYLNDEMTRTCILRWAGPNLFVTGSAYSFTYRCATIDSPVCTVLLPTERGIRVSLYYKSVRLISCFEWGGPAAPTTCSKNTKLSQNLRPGTYVKCVAYAHAQLAHQINMFGFCSSRA